MKSNNASALSGILIAVILIVVNTAVYAKTSITLTPAGGITMPAGYSDASLEVEVQQKADLNGPIIADSLAMGNITGYPVGKAHVGGLPHFSVGVALGTGMTNMRYFDDDRPESDNGSLPGITPNPVLHFALGLTKDFDVLGKYFSLSKTVVDPGLDTDIAKLTDYKLLSLGGKLRYNIVKRKKLLPFIFNFGGLTVSAGADFQYGDIRVQGDYDADLPEVDVSITAPAAFTGTITTQFDGQYSARVLYSIFSLSAQAVAYFDVFYLFSFYTGFGLTGNVGYFKMDFNGDGVLTTDDPAYNAAAGTDQIGTLLFESTNKYHPYYAIPTYLVGLEINLWVLKITGETMVNLYNRRDVNATVGVRVQI